MVCNLSYLGDIRMGLAEDPLKVRRIAEGSRTELLDLYKPQLKVEMYSTPFQTRLQRYSRVHPFPAKHKLHNSLRFNNWRIVYLV